MNKKMLEDNIISLLGIQNLSDEKKAVLLKQMSDVLEKRIFARILEQLTDTQAKQFVEAVDKNDDGKLTEVLAAATVDMQSLIDTEALALKKELGDVVKE